VQLHLIARFTTKFVFGRKPNLGRFFFLKFSLQMASQAKIEPPLIFCDGDMKKLLSYVPELKPLADGGLLTGFFL